MVYGEVAERRRFVIFGGLLAGLGLGGGTAATIESLGLNQMAPTIPIGWDLIGMAVGGLALGLGVGLMLAAAIR